MLNERGSCRPRAQPPPFNERDPVRWSWAPRDRQEVAACYASPQTTKNQQADHGRQLNVEATLNSVVVLG
jgi:hypothetical protein